MSEDGPIGVPEGALVNQDEWEQFVEQASRSHFRGLIRILSRLPSGPRCEACGSPFGGIGGRLMRATGKGPSRKNPRWCAGCFELAPPGGFTGNIGVLFVDVRGSTALTERVGPTEMAATLNRFYERVTRVVVQHGLIDKLIGDEVMGIYLPPFPPPDRFAQTLVSDALDVLASVGYGSDEGPVLDVGIGLDVGVAYVGHVGQGEISDFTAIGDVVNTASRLQAEAGAGEVVMTENVAESADLDPRRGRGQEFVLKGKTHPVTARVIGFGN